MGWRRDALTLAERAALSRVGTLPADAKPVRRVRHCVVHDPAGFPGEHAGLLVAWRRDGVAGWLGRVVFVVDEDDPSNASGEPLVVDAWVGAAALRPARRTE
jgi:hypothetical protein